MKNGGAYCYLNGKFLAQSKAAIGIGKAGVLRGYGVFESVRAVRQRPFMLAKHLRRLKVSARALGLKWPLKYKHTEKAVLKLLKFNDYPYARVRLVLTGGDLTGSTRIDPGSSDFFIIVYPYKPLPSKYYQQGVKLITHEYKREFPNAKTINYLTAVALEPLKRRKGAYEILYTWKGQVLECTTSNFFIVKNKKIVTPKTGILPGVTRELVINTAKAEGLAVEERKVSLKELSKTDEAFITATYKGVVPVTKVNGLIIGGGRVGKITKLLMSKYNPLLNG